MTRNGHNALKHYAALKGLLTTTDSETNSKLHGLGRLQRSPFYVRSRCYLKPIGNTRLQVLTPIPWELVLRSLGQRLSYQFDSLGTDSDPASSVLQLILELLLIAPLI